tara:strand:- start:853 stop:1782 length:930 start_codon:yes stop_codon:yes gene_type:complete
MCVIIIKQKEQMMSREIAKTSARINPHGLGIIWLDTYEVTYHKSKDYGVLLTDRPFIAHFRYATVGAINRENTHPFVCGVQKDEYLMMNGTINGLGNAQMCDSKVLANQLGLRPRHTWKQEIEQFDCRFVTVNVRNRSFQMYNRGDWHYRDGIWYSKANVLQENIIAVYGTLKKDYSNYHNYLTTSKFIGSGVTKDRYPLLIQGLPYMVEQKGVGYNVQVDVFKVSDDALARLDVLEGHPKWYVRKQVPIHVKGRVINCWVYFNPKTITKDTQMHKTYVQHNYRNFYSTPTTETYTPSLWDDMEAILNS